MNWMEANLVYDHHDASLRANSEHMLDQAPRRIAAITTAFVRRWEVLGMPTRVTYGINAFPKNSPSHCKIEAYLAPYGWVSFDVSETQKLIAEIRKASTLSDTDKARLVERAQARLMSGFRDNTWYLQTRGTDYELVPKASKVRAVVRTAYIEADGVPLQDFDTADKSQKSFAWITVHEYRPDHAVPYPFTDWKTLESKEDRTMTDTPRFIMIGGFLGAGKTTTIARLARRFKRRANASAIVTNDQATDLVDTNSLRSQGFDVGEVAGSCFCCNFNELTATVERLGADRRPDVVIAEPVGSCTDLVATVIRPLQQMYSQPFDIAPYGVIVKPSHGAKILKHVAQGGFSPKAEYIFRKQIEEADFVIVNRIDELPAAEVEELSQLLEADFPGRTVVRMSAKTGEGFDAFCEFLDQQGNFGRRVMDVDYDVYAEGEAELGWLNSQAAL